MGNINLDSMSRTVGTFPNGKVQITKHFADEVYLYRIKKNGDEMPFHRTKSADYILEMTKHDYTGFDQMEAQT